MTTDRPCKIIEQLFLLAQDVTPVARARIAACIVHRNKIMSFGINQQKTHPMASKYSKHESAIYLHAEVAAIINFIKKYDVELLKKSTLYIARAKCDPQDNVVYGMAKPCSGCERAILEFGIKKVIYTLNSGHIAIGTY